MAKYALLLLLLVATAAQAQQPISHYQLPQPGNQTSTIPNDPALKDLMWNKWDTENFTILSLDAEQGRYLYQNIEQMKKWVYARWGLPDVKFSAECRILCVPNKELMKKLFRLEASHGEVRREGGKIKMSVLWLVLDQKPSEVIPPSLTVISMAELEQTQQYKVGYWAQRGMSLLNGTLPQIRGNLGALAGPMSRDDKVYFSAKLFSMTEEEWTKETPDRRQLFDQEAAALCLLLRQEFGQKNLHRFLATSQSEQDFVTTYGFNGYTEFDATLKRYMQNLSTDIAQNRTPDKYLQISPPER